MKIQFAYVGADSRTAIAAGVYPADAGISVFAVDPDTGALDLIQTMVSDNAFHFAFDSTQRRIYVVNLIEEFEGETSGAVEAYGIDPDTGRLTFLNRQSSRGSTPAQPAVDPTGRFLVVANYNGENVVVLPINPDGSLEPVIAEVKRSGSGPDTGRQERSHPHAAIFDPTGSFVAVADLGTDQVATYKLDPVSGALTLVGQASTAPGSGPRHIAFNAAATLMYVLNELDATITIFAFDAASGAVGDELQTISTVPDDFFGLRSTAEIFLHPSGRFLYSSNRGWDEEVSPEGDAIVTFAVDSESGKLTLIEHTTEGIGTPWNFAFDREGKWLYAANQAGSTITQYAIDPATGTLSGPISTTPTPAPFVIMLSNA